MAAAIARKVAPNTFPPHAAVRRAAVTNNEGKGETMKTIMLGLAALITSTGLASAEVASWYGTENGQHRTATGERYTGNEMTAAHRTLPFGTRVTVCHSGCVTVRINDRGPFVRGRDLDLSRAAARAIGCGGVCHVTMNR